MNSILIGILCAFLAGNEELGAKAGGRNASLADSDGPVKARTGTTARKARPVAEEGALKDPVEQEYEKLVAQDETVLKEVEKLQKDFAAYEAKGAAGPRGALAAKVQEKLDGLRKSYEDFLEKHPRHVDALVAYASFLGEIDEEEGAIVQLEKARAIDLKNPTPWNNLANIFAHIGPIKKAFQYFEKAIELDPAESVYLHNLATVTYLFRKDAAETYRIDEEAVFNRSLDLYRKAMKLDPDNILLATDFAQSYYGIRPLRAEDAISAWKHALSLAKSQAEKEGVYIHLARVELSSGRFVEAQKHLDMVKDPEMVELRDRLQQNLEKKKAEFKALNASATLNASTEKGPPDRGSVERINTAGRSNGGNNSGGEVSRSE